MTRWLWAAVLLALYAPTAWAEACTRIAIMPPLTRDPNLGRWVEGEVALKLEQQAGGGCMRVTNLELTDDAFDEVGSNYYVSLAVEDLPEHRRKILVERTGATRLAHIKAQGSRISVTIFHLDPSKPLSVDRSFSFLVDRSKVKQARTSVFWRYIALLTPNTYSLGISQTIVSVRPDEPYARGEVRLKGGLPPILSSFSVAKIRHPLGFEDWDFGFSVFPGAYLFSIDQESDLRLIDPKLASIDLPETVTVHVAVYGACQNFNAQLSFYSPLGTTYSSLGLGPCFYQLQTDMKPPDYQGALAFRFVLGHRVFVEKQTFVFFDFDILGFGRELYNTTYIHSSAISRVTIGLGFYVPSVEYAFLNLFSRG